MSSTDESNYNAIISDVREKVVALNRALEVAYHHGMIADVQAFHPPLTRNKPEVVVELTGAIRYSQEHKTSSNAFQEELHKIIQEEENDDN